MTAFEWYFVALGTLAVLAGSFGRKAEKGLRIAAFIFGILALFTGLAHFLLGR